MYSQNANFADRLNIHEPAAPKSWDSIARRFVEHDTTAQETFGELPVAIDERHWRNFGRPDNVQVAAQPARRGDPLWHIRQLPGFIYLGSPYSLYKGGYDEAAHIVSRAAASLMATGLCIYAPITHGHFISGQGDLPQTWEFWKAQCQPMIDAAAALIVLQMDGWAESVGLTYEIEEFGIAGKPVVYLEPTALTAGRVAG